MGMPTPLLAAAVVLTIASLICSAAVDQLPVRTDATKPMNGGVGAGDVRRAMRGRTLTASEKKSLQQPRRDWATEFRGYMARYGKEYATIEETRERYHTYIANVQHIEAHNQQNLSYRLGINEFTDLRFEEFKSLFLMQVPQECSATKGNHVKSKEDALPVKVDWREKNIVSPVKNQGNCGSCWTFSATGAIEAAWTQATGENVSLSEQQLVDCAQAFNNNGCGGGLPSQAFEYVKYNGGLDTEASYPYTAQDGKCDYKRPNVGARVYDVINITMGNEEDLKDAVAFQRPVSIAFEVVSDFQSYSSGIYSSKVCTSDPTSVNHAVLAVGYVAESGKTPYWIVKNSWGKSWGLEGYFLIEQGKDMCGLASCASYPVVTEC